MENTVTAVHTGTPEAHNAFPATDTPLSRNGTLGRVYGGDKGLVHIKDGDRAEVGLMVADAVNLIIRKKAMDDNPQQQAWGKPLCPGCYMIALFNAAIALAVANGQPLTELGNTLSHAFAKLVADPDSGTTEEIEVMLDPD